MVQHSGHKSGARALHGIANEATFTTTSARLGKQMSSTTKANQRWDSEEEGYLQYTSSGNKYQKKKKIIHTLCGLWTVLIQRHFSHQERKILLPKRYNKTLGERVSVYILIFNLTTTNAHAPRICRLLRIRAYKASPWDPTSLPEYEDLFCIPVRYK